MLKKLKNKLILIILGIILIFGYIYLFNSDSQIPDTVQEQPPAAVKNTDQIEAPKETVRESTKENVTIKNQEATLEIEGVIYKTQIPETTAVYEFMDTLRKEGKINFKEKNYIGLGKLIEEINGIRSNGDRNWIYYVNGKKAAIGVSNYKIHPGDVVSWKYEEEIY